MTTTTARRAGLTLAVATSLIILWLRGAVGIVGVEGAPPDLLFVGVIAIAIAGAIVARGRPDGMDRAMVVAAAAALLAGGIALTVDHESVTSPAAEVIGMSAMFAGMYLAAAWLFRAARRKPATLDL